MAIYVKPNYHIPDVNAAAKRITAMLDLSDEQFEEAKKSGEFFKARDIVENWRAAHNFPLNTFYMTLKRRGEHISRNAIAAQRLKRLVSIVLKLAGEPNMKLSQMQDIGGCRSILPTLDDVYRMRELYRNRPAHKFIGEKDYIAGPKPTGYRGIHLKYRFIGTSISKPWNDLKIEIQLRSMLQHRWATSVEAVGTFTVQALKSNLGRDEWLRFFALMASVYAIREGCKTVPGTPGNLAELNAEIAALNKQHHLQATIAHYRKIAPTIERQRKAKYFLITLDPVQKTVAIRGYKYFESRAANRDYTEFETRLKGGSSNVVLVSTSSVSALKRAYPNYFLDTQEFLRDMSAITGEPIT